MRAPCQGCEKREIGCHGSCEPYRDFRQHCENINRLRALDHIGVPDTYTAKKRSEAVRAANYNKKRKG